ncbi:MAG TPA: hypothetical protein VLV90_13650 [Burkholderiales bacterium]|nr:hypothetical protein [Burkholderiales bacterium]
MPLHPISSKRAAAVVLAAFAVASLAGCAASDAGMRAQPQASATRAETGELGGTTWRLLDWSSKTGTEDFKDKVLVFGTDGWVTTTITHKDGRVATERESYRVVGNTLTLDKGGRLVSYRILRQGHQLNVEGDRDWSVLGRL